jgi:hypothetical protein
MGRKYTCLEKRGYIVIPDPDDKAVQEAYKDGVFRSFERHSRVGIPAERDFLEDVDSLRSQGAKHVTLKTGAYRPSAVAYTLKIASEARLDYVTFDGAGGGTGMSPVPMMDEMGTPTVYLEAQVLRCAEVLKKKGRYVPDIIMGGGFISETQIFKAIAMSNFGEGPYVKAILMARAPLTAVMKASYFIELAEKGRLPRSFVDRYGDMPEIFFINSRALKENYGEKSKKIPWEAIALYSYLYDRIKVGLQQLMAGARKWRLDLIDRSDIVALTERASRATGIPLIEDAEADVIEKLIS